MHFSLMLFYMSQLFKLSFFWKRKQNERTKAIYLLNHSTFQQEQPQQQQSNDAQQETQKGLQYRSNESN